MGVVTVVGEEGVQVLVEFVGGPRDGKRSFVVATTDIEGKPIPPSGFAAEQLTDGIAAAGAGKYFRDGISPDGEALTYIWQLDGPAASAPPSDLATRIRQDYARRATAGQDQGDSPKRRAMPLRARIDRRES